MSTDDAIAGRELDAEIARVVFGHEVKLVTDDERSSSDGCDLQDVEQRYPWRYEVDGEMVGGWGHLLPYSVSIAAAMLVVEHMRALGFEYSIGTEPDGTWEVETMVGEALAAQGYRGSYTRGTLPFAFCRGALHAYKALAAVPAVRGREGE